MEKFLLKNASDLDDPEYIRARLNLDDTKHLIPVKFPCVAVITYAGAGWDEIGFIYKSDFAEQR